MSEEEVSTLARFAMPGAFRGLVNGCRAQLPADAYVLTQGDALQARLEASATGAQDAAIAAFMEMGMTDDPGMGEVLGNMPPSVLGPFLNEMVAGMVATQIKPEQCVTADRALALLDPLPPENLAALLGLIVVEMQKDDTEEAPEAAEAEVK